MRNALMLGVVMVLTACGRQPTQAELDEAKGHVKSFLDSAEQARRAAELLGLFPEYECGEIHGEFLDGIAEGLRGEAQCATVTVDGDLIQVTLPESGCSLKGITATGKATFRYSKGESRTEVEADFRELRIDGQTLPIRAGYGTCGDEKRYWLLAEGAVPKQSDRQYKLDVKLAGRDGLPVIGSTTYIIDGTGELKKDATDVITLTGVTYDVGQYLPKEGTLKVETAGGRTIEATFSTTLWRFGEVEVSIDDSATATIPIVR